MPKQLILPKDATYSGIDVTWTPSAQRLDISGWYESYAGIQNSSLTLLEFFRELGITEKDCAKAFSKKETGDNGKR